MLKLLLFLIIMGATLTLFHAIFGGGISSDPASPDFWGKVWGAARGALPNSTQSGGPPPERYPGTQPGMIGA